MMALAHFLLHPHLQPGNLLWKYQKEDLALNGTGLKFLLCSMEFVSSHSVGYREDFGFLLQRFCRLLWNVRPGTVIPMGR